MSAPIRIVAMVVVTALFVWGFFALAGRWDWMRGWTYICILTAGNIINELVLWLNNPELFRMRGRAGEGTKTWDKACLALFGLTIVLIAIAGALAAGRYQWSVMPLWLWPCGAALYTGGQALLIWSMVVNPHFEKTVRIQKDRGHRVIDGGPYAHVRHPGYVGVIMGYILGSPFLLGSWWALLPATLSALTLVARTALEDRMLLEELEGYKAYAKRVRYRLVPYFW
jgi:protein-S-isoprenylcysteine O-methyltransferase Ste14